MTFALTIAKCKGWKKFALNVPSNMMNLPDLLQVLGHAFNPHHYKKGYNVILETQKEYSIPLFKLFNTLLTLILCIDSNINCSNIFPPFRRAHSAGWVWRGELCVRTRRGGWTPPRGVFPRLCPPAVPRASRPLRLTPHQPQGPAEVHVSLGDGDQREGGGQWAWPRPGGRHSEPVCGGQPAGNAATCLKGEWIRVACSTAVVCHFKVDLRVYIS